MREILAAALVSVGLLASGASASHKHERASDQSVHHKDPKDVDNKLDIQRVAFRGHGDGDATLVIRTHKKWGCGYIAGTALDDASAASIRWNVDKNRDPYIEREAFFGCDDDGWSLHWGENKTFAARRPNRRILKVRLPLDDLGLDRKKNLRLIALSFVNGTIDGEIHVEETDATKALAPLAGD